MFLIGSDSLGLFVLFVHFFYILFVHFFYIGSDNLDPMEAWAAGCQMVLSLSVSLSRARARLSLSLSFSPSYALPTFLPPSLPKP